MNRSEKILVFIMSLAPLALLFALYSNTMIKILAFPAILLGFIFRISETYVILLYLISAPFIIYFVMVIQTIAYAIAATLYRSMKRLAEN